MAYQETMSSRKTIQEWSHAHDVLTSFAADFSCIQDKILPILKFCYDNLKDEKFRKLLDMRGSYRWEQRQRRS
uniref:Uncharacterized protein n=1 Tax=Brassica oleracea TaxID=3712 RepID=A0A3P6FAV1_BRAOL|nr:unnamed protein product [Brassica oleracea]